MEPAAEAVDAVDDPFDFQVDPGQFLLGEEAVDVVLLVAQMLVLIWRILIEIPLDVKLLDL